MQTTRKGNPHHGKESPQSGNNSTHNFDADQMCVHMSIPSPRSSRWLKMEPHSQFSVKWTSHSQNTIRGGPSRQPLFHFQSNHSLTIKSPSIIGCFAQTKSGEKTPGEQLISAKVIGISSLSYKGKQGIGDIILPCPTRQKMIDGLPPFH